MLKQNEVVHLDSDQLEKLFEQLGEAGAEDEEGGARDDG